MSDLSTASTSIIDALANSAGGGMVEEYEVGRGRRRVKRGKVTEQVDAALKLSAIVARQSSGLFGKAKLRSERD